MGSVGSGVAGEQEFAMNWTVAMEQAGGSGRGSVRGEETGTGIERERLERERERERERARERERERIEREKIEREREREMQAAGLDVCGNIVGRGGNEKNVGMNQHHHREVASARADGETNPGGHNPPNHNPPKILPMSGKLEQAMQSNSGLVRPSAFKPVVPKSFHSMQNLVGQAGGAGSEGKAEARNEGFAESRGGRRGRDGAGAESGEVPEALLLDQDSPVRVSRGEGSGSGCGPPAVLGPLSASTSHINRLGMDLEDRLWEKEQEVQHMRRNLDQSEAAIIQVFEEKQRVWERQMDELRQNYASRLQQVTRRAQRTQTALQAQISRLSQDKRRLQEEMAALLAQREELERKCLDYRKEQADILPRLEETKWEVCQKAGEISLLKQQLRESQAEVTQRAGEMLALRGQLKELNAQLREREEAMLGLKDSYSSKTLELEKCEGELRRTLSEEAQRQERQQREEAQWRDVQQRQDASMQDIRMRQDAQSRPEIQLRHEAQLRQDAHHRHETQIRELRRQLEQLQAALRLERQHRERQALNFDQERHTWQDEKERVLKYQAQLQLSYVETLQKNQALEKRMSQLGPKPTTTSTSTAVTTTTTITSSSPTSSNSPPPPPALLPLSPQSPPSLSGPIALTISPPCEDQKGPPSLHQLAPPWAGPSRLERIESTEI
uniref:Leucine zipper tumor suppressor family member 3 n=1 Tax=Tetraodon nigroviridis TaxID=99883 RepID=H3BZV2_TETNG